MAVGHGILRSYNLVLFLCIYLILGGITLETERKKHTESNVAITFISKELARQQLLLYSEGIYTIIYSYICAW